MKIFIIGSRGQLGTDCCHLLAQGNDTVGCDFPQVDLGSEESVHSHIEAARPDVIINCAAYTAVDACETDRELAWKINAEGPKFLAQAAENAHARLIHVSTDYVFDGRKPVPQHYLEDDPANPVSEYGRSKLAGEQAVQRHAANYVILRTAWLYSHSGKNFVKTMLRLALAGPGREMKVVDDQFGSLTWSHTLARQIQMLLGNDIQGIVHTTSEGYSSWYEAARYFLDAMAVPYRMRPCTTAEYPTPAIRPANSILENSVLKQAGISIFADWREEIDRFAVQHKEHLLAEAKAALRQ